MVLFAVPRGGEMHHLMVAFAVGVRFGGVCGGIGAGAGGDALEVPGAAAE